MDKIKKGLGRGLSSLIGETKIEVQKNQLPVSDLIPNKYQPRKNFDEINLIDEFSYDQEKVSKFIGKSRSYITNSLRILTLPNDVIKFIETKKLSSGHAKILVGLENATFVANKIIEKKLSVREAENFVKIFKKKKNSKLNKDSNIIALELSISNKIGLNVDIQNNRRNKGKISFEYKDLDQLNKIIETIKSYY
jgi:ParB family chromosome partitioning protein